MIKTIKKVLYLFPSGDKWKLLILFLMMMVSALLEVLGVGMIPAFVSVIASPEEILNMERLKPLWDVLGVTSPGDLLVYCGFLLMIVFIVKNGYVLFNNYIQTRFIWERFEYIGTKLFQKYMTAPYEFHLNRNSSELLRNITMESYYLVRNLITHFLKIIMNLILALGIFTMLIWVEPFNTFLVFIFLGVGGGIFLKSIREKTGKYGKSAQSDRAEMIQAVNEGLGGLKEARVLNRENWFYNNFKRNIRSYKKSLIFREIASSANKPIIETIAVIGMLLVALLLYWQGRRLDTIIPILALFATATVRLMPAIKEITTAVINLKYYIYTIDPIFSDFKSLEDYLLKDVEGGKKANVTDQQERKKRRLRLKAEIQFHNVTYSYPNTDVPVIEGLSLKIEKSSVIGFVGTSGAGKTTLIDLLLGLIKPQQGEIVVDEVDIFDDLNAWQKNIGYIPQFIFLSDSTIKKNVAFGISEERIDQDKLYAALDAAQLTEFIDELPQGINTTIGEHGTRLSGGQRQRIGIARALYHDPEVLIMDEATSALDNKTEKSVMDAVETLKEDRTVIIIAHRLTTVKNCNRIYLMKKGIITDQGTYNELLDISPEFREMNALGNQE